MNTNNLWESREDLSRIDEEETIEDDKRSMKLQITKLIKDVERYKQKNYSLQCKLEVSTSMQAELREVNEGFERTVNKFEETMAKKINEMEEKHVEEKKDLLSRLSEMEAEILKKAEETEGLKIKIKELNEKLQSTANTMPVFIEDNSDLEEKISDLMGQLKEKDQQMKQVEEKLNHIDNENIELKLILSATKQELSEKNEKLENTRDELMELKMELAEVKEKPASETSKGNSLFAEVEDRRKKMLDQMKALRKGYQDAKRIADMKEAENRSLKMEKAALLCKWEDDTVNSRYQDTQLMDKYKARISELELKLRDQQKKYRQLENQGQPTGSALSYFQSTLETKRKEIDELESQLERVSMQAVLEEEMKHNLSTQVRRWRWKAMSCEAKLSSIRSHLSADQSASNSEIMKILEQTFKPSQFKETDDLTLLPEVADKDVMILGELMKVPQPRDTSETPVEINDSLLDNSTECKMLKMSPTNSSLNLVPPVFMNETVNLRSEQNLEIKREIVEKELEELEIFRTVDRVKTEVKVQNAPILKSVMSGVKEKEKKTIKFTEDTVDPPPKILRRQATPKYPIIFASNPPKKK